jgi:hypothetical protein
VVRDANGQALAYPYARENEDEAPQAKLLTGDEARRIAVNIARLAELLEKVTHVATPATGPPVSDLGGASRGPRSKGRVL